MKSIQRTILITGGAGFIGSHLVERLLQEGQGVICLDNFDPFYGHKIKQATLQVALKEVSGTLKQTVADRYVRFAHRRLRLTGNQIYLTDERWTHIVNTHPEMDSLMNNLLLTLQTGRRKQEPLDPSKYKYYNRFDILETGYNHIVVVVKFSEKVEKDTKKRISNNFVLTAYQTFIFSR